MEISKLYDLIENSLLDKWLEELEEEDRNGYKKDVAKYKEELYDVLSEEQKKLADRFECTVKSYLYDLYYFINIRILNLGIEMGMQLQQAFDGQEDI